MKSEIIARIRQNLEILEKNEPEKLEEYDAVPILLSIVKESVNLAAASFGCKQIQQWKESDDPIFYRFLSELKFALESQTSYLDSIETPLTDQENIVLTKIATCRDALEEAVRQKEHLLKDIQTLSDQESALQDTHAKISDMLEKKESLEKAIKQYAGIDPEQLASEISEKETVLKNLEQTCAPLLEKQAALDAKTTGIRETIDGLSHEIEYMESTCGDRPPILNDHLPYWIQKIREQVVLKDNHIKKLADELHDQAEILKDIDLKLQNKMQEMEAYADTAAEKQEIFNRHFKANQGLGKRFAESLADVKQDIEDVHSEIEFRLTACDDYLNTLRSRIAQAQERFRQIGIRDA